jgi:CheY-like chemotaxis protein
MDYGLRYILDLIRGISKMKNSKLRILIVDDIKDHAMLIGKMVNYLGFVAEIATTFKEAVQKLTAAKGKQDYDLLITDYELSPTENGKLLTNIAVNLYPNLPVIMITKNWDFEDIPMHDNFHLLLKDDPDLSIRDRLDSILYSIMSNKIQERKLYKSVKASGDLLMAAEANLEYNPKKTMEN